jgi:hypothetical protein
MAAQLHFAEDTFALHFLFERLERLIDVVITDLNEHALRPSQVQLLFLHENTTVMLLQRATPMRREDFDPTL